MLKISLLIIFNIYAITSTTAQAEIDGIGLPQGRFVEVKQHRMHLDCSGAGPVTVVVDSGIGGSSIEWFLVRESLGESVRFCAYDRAGYGWSDPGVASRTTKNISHELRMLLNNAGEKPPYLMVGHSFGGFTARYFAYRFPNDVMGLLLVDASHPDQISRMNKLVTGTQKRTGGENPLQMPKGNSVENLPELQQLQAGFLNSRRKAIFAQMDEIKYFQQSAEQVRQAMPLPNIPVLVVTRGKQVWPENKQGLFMEKTWLDLQESLSALTINGRHLLATQSGHNIHLDQPELLSDQIRTMIRSYQSAVLHAGVVDLNQDGGSL